jgi:hypothetical protein
MSVLVSGYVHVRSRLDASTCVWWSKITFHCSHFWTTKFKFLNPTADVLKDGSNESQIDVQSFFFFELAYSLF